MRIHLLLSIILILLIIILSYTIYMLKKQKENFWLSKLWKKENTKTIVSSLICIVGGLIVGCIILLLFGGKNVGGLNISWTSTKDAIQLLFFGVLSKGKDANNNLIFGWNGVNLGNMLFKTIPLLLCGLSVAVAFKTGLFNIGTPGQYLMGSAATLIVALSIPSTVVPTFIIWILAFFAGILFGALWGAIPGAFKALLNINEVITCIMTNWIAANIVTFIFDKNKGMFKHLLDPSGTKNYAYVYKTTHNNVSTIKLGLDKIFVGSQVNAGIIIAIVIAIIIYIILNKTTFGYSLKACGSNKNAAKYAGINEKVNIIISMAIAGGLAGCGAALYYLSGNTEFKWETYQSLPEVAFNGIPVALLAVNSPIGVIFSSLFMAGLDVSGMQIKYLTTYNEFITSIISAIIVYFSAFALFIKTLFKKNKKKKEQ
ncbi:MAG: ABC transporter permease [Bacilli bacterium]|nr:ABC transporter permease [Acholeplasmataceae bacterium]MDY2902066.1 ABC transporter permease [Bacilli bacterium]